MIMQQMDDLNVSPPPAPSDQVAVGDLNSDAPGSGARKNLGKRQMELMPVAYWLMVWRPLLFNMPELRNALIALDAWQRGGDDVLDRWFAVDCTPRRAVDAVKVLEFGAKKYKAWNWAKGMDWSVPTGCILRHAEKILDGEVTDPESGQPHYAHIVCNMMMLAYYRTNYTAGDDRPPRGE